MIYSEHVVKFQKKNYDLLDLDLEYNTSDLDAVRKRKIAFSWALEFVTPPSPHSLPCTKINRL